MKPEHCKDCIYKAPLVANLSKEELEILTEKSFHVTYNPGETIFKQGSPITHLIFMRTGLAKVYIEGYDSKNLLLQYLQPKEFLGGPGAFVDNLHHFSVSAVEKSSICFIDIKTVKQFLESNNRFAMAYIEDLSRKGIYNFDRFISLTQKHMHGRLADAILYLKNTIYNVDTEKFPFSRDDFASISGLTKDSVIRVLKEFSKGGVITMDIHDISVMNEKMLKKISEYG